MLNTPPSPLLREGGHTTNSPPIKEGMGKVFPTSLGLRANRGTQRSGQSLVEVLVALAIFLVFVSGVAGLVARYANTLIRADDFHDVGYIAQESFDAVQAIAYASWLSLADGTYGLNHTTGQWQFHGSPDLINTTYTRSITIASVNRDNTCSIVSIGGTSDPDTKKVTVQIAWTPVIGSQDYQVTRYFTHWKNPSPNCGTLQSEGFEFDVSNASIGDNHKSLLNIKFKNVGATPITVDRITTTWTLPSPKITEIKIEETNHWHKNGPGTPTGAQSSGTELDIVDLSMAAGQTYEVDRFRFDAFMTSATITITVKFEDGSTKSVTFSPPDD